MNVALCCMVKDEPDLLEWVDWHLNLGVDHIFIYDNGSKVPVRVDRSRVTVETFYGKGVMVRAYNKCLVDHGKKFDWIGFIDADEFVLTLREPLKEILHDYRDFGGLVVHWALFGSSGHLTRQPSVIDAYVHRAPFTDNTSRLVKTFCQPARVRKFESSHWAKYRTPWFAVNETKRRVNKGKTDPSLNRIRLNHYFLRSREDMEMKCKRGWGFTDRSREMQELEGFDARCTVEDTYARKCHHTR